MKVEVIDLVRSFRRGVNAVDGLSFSFAGGDVVGFVGPNGAGKTTTMRILATLDTPDSGDILIDGHSVLDEPAFAHRAIGFMPDDLPSLSDTTVDEYIDFFGRAYGLSGAPLRAAVEGVEGFTGLDGFRDKTLASLSKGMKQRVSLARAIVHDPAVVVMDEPANGLDPRARVELRELVSALAAGGKAILVSSHILSELEEMCTSTVIIERGRRIDVAKVAPSLDVWVKIRIAGVAPDAARLAIAEIPGVKETASTAAFVRARIASGDESVAALSSAMAARRLVPLHFEPEAGRLEDIFMQVTKGELS